jgi:hypothetical protein
LYRPYYVPSSGPNLNLPYEYEVPYQQYRTNPLYIAPTYDINRVLTGSVPSNYTYGESRDKGTPRSYLGLNGVYSPVPDSVAHRQGKTGKRV